MVRVYDFDKHYADGQAGQSVTNLAPEDWGGQTVQPW
jgi:hypothetical protein